jgi:hypothetical protein
MLGANWSTSSVPDPGAADVRVCVPPRSGVSAARQAVPMGLAFALGPGRPAACRGGAAFDAADAASGGKRATTCAADSRLAQLQLRRQWQCQERRHARGKKPSPLVGEGVVSLGETTGEGSIATGA